MVRPDQQERGSILPWLYQFLPSVHQRFLPSCSSSLRSHQERREMALDHGGAVRLRLTKVRSHLHSDIGFSGQLPSRPFRIEADSSDFATGAVLSQQSPESGKWHPVAFLSKSLSPVERNYEIHDKEMLAIIRAMEEWRQFLEGAEHQFEVWMDHKNLEYFMTVEWARVRWAKSEAGRWLAQRGMRAKVDVLVINLQTSIYS
jgi:RNase H-like domain found in reverse transcriptase